MDNKGRTSSKFLFRCDQCSNSQIYRSVTGVAEVGSRKNKTRCDDSSVLVGRLICSGSEKLKLNHAALNIAPPPPPSSVTAIQKALAVMAAREACASMDRA